MNTIDTSQAPRPSPPQRASQSPEARQQEKAPKSATGTQSQEEAAPAAAPEERASKPSLDLDKIEKTTQVIQQYLESIGRELNFEVHQETNDVVIKVFRKSDGALIRQIPSEEWMKQAQSGKEATGVLLEESV